MPKIDIPVVSGNRHKSEKININESIFDLPPRDPGRIPSLPRPLTVQKKTPPLTRIPPKDIKLKVEQELAIAVSGPIPIPPPNPKIVPSKRKEEQVPNLLEII